MKRALGIITSITVWACIGAFAGHWIGSKGGYARGVRDIAEVIHLLREGQEPPAPYTQGEI